MENKKSLNQEEIQFILLQLESGKTYSCRGRIGVGLMYKDGVFIRVNYDEYDEIAYPFNSKSDFIEFLKNIDLGSEFGYWQNLVNPVYWNKKKVD